MPGEPCALNSTTIGVNLGGVDQSGGKKTKGMPSLFLLPVPIVPCVVILYPLTLKERLFWLFMFSLTCFF